MSKTLKLVIDTIGNVQLNEKNYLGSGGEATVYKFNNYAVKVYTDPKKTIAKSKIDELVKISSTNVLKPLHAVYNSPNNVVGYVMQFVSDAEPLCK